METPIPLNTQPPSLNSHSPAELFPNDYCSVEPLAGDSSTASATAGVCPDINLGTAECDITCSQSAGPLCFELVNDPDKDFILTGVQEGFDLIPRNATVLPALTKNNKSALRPGAKEQIEEQLSEGLSLGHFATSTTLPTIVNAIGAVPKRDSSELRMIMDCSRPFAASANSYMDLDHYK